MLFRSWRFEREHGAASFEPLSGSPSVGGPGYDVAVVHARHRAYNALKWREIAPLLVDARNAFDRAEIERDGVRYLGIGRPASPSLE